MPLYQDLFMRDNFGDTGVTPVLDAYVSGSPDIIPYGNQQLNTGTTPYGPPLIDVPLNNNVVNNIYVRAKNNASVSGSGQIYLYYTDATLLTNVTSWSQNALQNFNGNNYAVLANVGAGQVAFGDQPFAWNPQAAPGQHFCLVGQVVTANNPNPLPANFTSWQAFVNWVRYNANVAWHNVQIVNTLPAQGYQNSLVFQNVGAQPSFYTFTATYSGMPAGSVLRVYALPGVGFSGFDTGAQTINNGSGILPVSGTFPAGYQTLVYCTCTFPGGPVTPPAGVTIVLESWGPQSGVELEENAHFRPFALAPEALGVGAADVGLGADGMLVQISSYNVYFSPPSLAEGAPTAHVLAKAKSRTA